MRAPPYIPPSDGGYDTWLLNFTTLLSANPTDYGLVAGDATACAAVYTAWHPAYLAAIDPSTKTPVTVAAKDTARATGEPTIRVYAQKIAKNPAVADALKVGIGLNPPNTTPSPVPPPLVAPALSVISASSLLHTIKVQNPDTPSSKAKPPGCTGVQIMRNVGETYATDPAQCTLYGVWTKAPNTSQFDVSQIGKKVTYFARYMTQSGPGGQSQPGPWSAALQSVVV